MNLIVAVAAFATLIQALCCAHGYKTFFLSEECARHSFIDIHMRSLEHNSSGILKSSKNGKLIENLHCEIRLKPPLAYGVVVSVRTIDMPPYTKSYDDCINYLKIYTDGDSPVQLCGYSSDTLEYDFYESSGPMRLVLHTNTTSVSHNDTKFQFQLTFTAFRRAKLWCPKEEFHCHNDRCIWRGLTCDGHNNCGDLSDESGPAKCGKSLSLPQSIGIVVGTILLCIVLVTGITCLRRYLIGSRFQRLSGQNCPAEAERSYAEGYQNAVNSQHPSVNSTARRLASSDPPPKYEDIVTEHAAVNITT